MQPNFEFIESDPNPLPPALQLAQDALAQTRAYHQNLQTQQQQLADTTPPPLTYAGQSQGQPLLRTPEGNLQKRALAGSGLDTVSEADKIAVQSDQANGLSKRSNELLRKAILS